MPREDKKTANHADVGRHGTQHPSTGSGKNPGPRGKVAWNLRTRMESLVATMEQGKEKRAGNKAPELRRGLCMR